MEPKNQFSMSVTLFIIYYIQNICNYKNVLIIQYFYSLEESSLSVGGPSATPISKFRPDGYSRLSLRLPAERLVELEVVY